jgi:hypothetical protein
VARGVLPKAYLRISPDLDQHEDPLVMVILICAANRQPRRGRFKSTAIVERLVGRKRFRECVVRGDLIHEGTAWYLDGWDEWQEGDHTVGDRMARLRARRGVGSNRELSAYPDRIPASEASRRLGVRRLGASSNEDKVPGLRPIGYAAERVVTGLRA